MHLILILAETSYIDTCTVSSRGVNDIYDWIDIMMCLPAQGDLWALKELKELKESPCVVMGSPVG